MLFVQAHLTREALQIKSCKWMTTKQALTHRMHWALLKWSKLGNDALHGGQPQMCYKNNLPGTTKTVLMQQTWRGSTCTEIWVDGWVTGHPKSSKYRRKFWLAWQFSRWSPDLCPQDIWMKMVQLVPTSLLFTYIHTLSYSHSVSGKKQVFCM